MKRLPSHLTSALLSASLLLSVAGCGGGSSTPVTLSGVAATGAPFVSGIVQVTDSTGRLVGTSAPVGSDGVFTVTLAADAKAPFVLVAARTDANGETQRLVSVVAEPQQTSVNVTPITTLIASRLSASGNPAQLAREVAEGDAALTPQAVAATVEEVKSILAPVLEATGTASLDPIKDSFAVNGTGYDRLLDAVSITIIPASASTSNVEVAVKQQLEEGQQPTAVSFSSSAAQLPVLPSVEAAKLPTEGLSVKIARFLEALTACYAIPFEQRVRGVSSASINAVTGSAADVIAPACRQVFASGNPATFLSNGVQVGRDANNNGAFSSLFRRGTTGVTFTQGNYEFTRGNGDIVISYKSRSVEGAETYDTFVLRQDGEGALGLIGNQYRFGGKVAAYHQKRNFVTLDQGVADYYSTGYNIDIPNTMVGDTPLFNRVVVTTPRGGVLTFKPNANLSYLALVKNVDTGGEILTGTSYIRLRSEFADPSNGLSHPRTFDTTLFFVETEWSEAELANARVGGSWRFEYYLNVDDPETRQNETTEPVVQYFKHRARALTIGELRTQGLTQLSPDIVASISDNAVNGALVFESNSPASIETENGGDGWVVGAGQLPPTSITLFGREGGQRFSDTWSFPSTARRVTIPCSRQSNNDTHCHDNGNGTFGPGFTEGATLDGLHLFARDSGGREYANFYAMYNLRLNR